MSSLIGQGGLRGPTGYVGNKIPSGYKLGQVANYNPQQMELFNQSFGSVSPDSYLSRLAGGDQGIFDEIEAPALRQFSGIQGNLASRFSGAGSFGSRKSSGFQNTMNSAASDFAQQLQAKRNSLRQNAIKDLHSMSQDLLSNRPYENFLTQKQQRRGFNMGGLLGGALGGAAGFVGGGPAGALSGAGMGYSAGSGLSGYQGLQNTGFNSTPDWNFGDWANENFGGGY